MISHCNINTGIYLPLKLLQTNKTLIKVSATVAYHFYEKYTLFHDLLL